MEEITPFLSVVIPLYNRKEYIGRCLYSVLDNAPDDIEVIVVDNGSTDDSKSIVEQIVDARLHLYSCPSKGVSKARNLGISKAHGKYIVFVDSDDYVASDYISAMYNLQCGHPEVDIFVFGLTKCNQDGQVIAKVCSEVLGYQPQKEFYQTFMAEQGQKGIYGFVSNKMIRRDFLKTHEICFNEHIRLAEDFDFYLRLFSKEPVLFFSDYCGYQYIQGVENSSCFQKNVDYFSLIRIWIQTYYFLTDKDGFDDNKNEIYKKINGLNSACFYELRKINYTKVREYVNQIHHIESVCGVLKYPMTMFQRWISDKKILTLFLFLSIRNLYLTLRGVHRKT